MGKGGVAASGKLYVIVACQAIDRVADYSHNDCF